MVEKRVCAELLRTAALSSTHKSERPLRGGKEGRRREGGWEGGREGGKDEKREKGGREGGKEGRDGG